MSEERIKSEHELEHEEEALTHEQLDEVAGGVGESNEKSGKEQLVK